MMLTGHRHALSSAALQQAMHDANTSQEALLLAYELGVPPSHIVCGHARQFELSVVPDGTGVEYFAIDRQGRMVGTAQ